MLTGIIRPCKAAIVIFSACALPLSVSAEWSGGLEGGTVLSGDNRGTRIGLSLNNSGRPISQEIEVEWVRSNSGISTYEALYKPRYWFTEKAYAFGEGIIRTFEKLSLDNYRRSLGGGLGIRLIDTDTQMLNLEAGLAHVTFFNIATEVAPKFDDSSIYTGATLEAAQVVYDLVRLELQTSFLTSEDIDELGAEVGISVRVSGGSIKYRYRYVGFNVSGFDRRSTNGSSISFDYGF